MNVPSPHSPGMRKAAILVMSLDQPAADLLLDQMDPQQAQRVRQAIMDLGPVDPDEQRAVLAEFHRRAPRAAPEPMPGIEVDGELAQKFAAPTPARPEPGPSQSPSGPPFRFLREAEADRLARVLVPERPQTIALVLSHLPPEHAGNVLSRLPARLQVDVVRRLVDLEETDPEILKEVERALQSRLSEQVRMQRRRVAGLSAVTGILEACDEGIGMQILENLLLHDRPLAEKLSPKPFEFADLIGLEDASLAATLRAADSELVTLALVGAPPEWTERFLTLVPEARAQQIRRELEHVGPIRLSDVEEARQRLADLARRLACQGRVRLPRRRPTAALA